LSVSSKPALLIYYYHKKSKNEFNNSFSHDYEADQVNYGYSIQGRKTRYACISSLGLTIKANKHKNTTMAVALLFRNPIKQPLDLEKKSLPFKKHINLLIKKQWK
jgi:hypothetical protein